MIPLWAYWTALSVVWLYVAVVLSLSWLKGLERFEVRRKSVALASASLSDRAEDFFYVNSKRVVATAAFVIFTVVFFLGPEGEKGVQGAHKFEGEQATVAEVAPDAGCVCDCGLDKQEEADERLSLDGYEPAQQSMESFRERLMNRDNADSEQ